MFLAIGPRSSAVRSRPTIASAKLTEARYAHGRGRFAFCNYWVGSALFWKKYIHICDPNGEVIDSKLSESEVSALMRSADKKSGLCYVPYILERLFSALLTVDSVIHSLSME